MRKKIVATKEGGAITGEERIREKTTGLYGAITQYEGRPGDYQVARIDSLTQELGDVTKQFDAFTASELPKVNTSLAKKKLKPIRPITRAEWDKENNPAEGGGSMTSAAVSLRLDGTMPGRTAAGFSLPLR